MEQLFWKKMHIAVRVSDDTGAMSPDARRFSDKLLVFMNGCLSCIKSKLLQAFHKPFHVLDFQHPMCPLRVARIGGALLKKKCGVQRSDRHEHAFPVTDSSGQTLPHNVYHLLRAGGM